MPFFLQNNVTTNTLEFQSKVLDLLESILRMAPGMMGGLTTAQGTKFLEIMNSILLSPLTAPNGTGTATAADMLAIKTARVGRV